MALQSASTVRATADRSKRLSLLNASSIGLRSGLGRQVKQRCTAGLDRLADTADLVAGQVVADDNVAGPQHRAEYLLDVSQERRTIDRPVEHQWRHQRILTQTAQEGGGMPVPIRHGSDQALTATGPAMAGAMFVVAQSLPRT
jgi:hypothetical protein